jgi:hypothetical protein
LKLAACLPIARHMQRVPIFIVGLISSAVMASAVTYSDSTFADLLWTGQKLSESSTPSTSFSAGYTGSFDGRTDVRLVTHFFGIADPIRSDIATFHAFSSASYDPASSGALASVSISFNINSATGGTSGGVARVPALVQGGIVYNAVDFAGVTITGTSWQSVTATGLDAGDFASAALANPDFSGAGAPIFFGFVLSNGSSLGASSTQTYIDNFVAEATPIPEPSTMAAVLGAAALGFARFRRMQRRSRV